MKYRLFVGSHTNYRINRKYRKSGMPASHAGTIKWLGSLHHTGPLVIAWGQALYGALDVAEYR